MAPHAETLQGQLGDSKPGERIRSMSRPSYPPPDFTCSYEYNCPYLDWLSTTWVLSEYRRAGETYQEHLRIIDTMGDELNTELKRIQALEKENAEFKAKNTALHRGH